MVTGGAGCAVVSGGRAVVVVTVDDGAVVSDGLVVGDRVVDAGAVVDGRVVAGAPPPLLLAKSTRP